MDAARVLATSVHLMNESGKHWVQGEYEEEFFVEDPSHPHAKETEFWNGDVGEYQRGVGYYDTRYCSIGGLRAAKTKFGELVGWPYATQVADASEVALAIVVLKMDETPRPATSMRCDDPNCSVCNPSVTSEKIKNGIVHPENTIIGYNDREGTKWENIKEAHSRAITALIEGTIPLSWQEYGEALANDVDFDV